jgi:phenylpropionate dioxygenase-like ring-hydroxylating dioxygenase large terminal subunit
MDLETSAAGGALPDPPRSAWYVACASRGLGRRPCRVELLGRPIVLFRDDGGVAHALEDRCPHRNVPLSLGRVRGDELECAYHGWRFGGDGACRFVPGLAEQRPSAARHAPCHAVAETGGHVWVWGRPGEAPAGEPFRFPFGDDRRYTRLRRAVDVHASLLDVAENAMDVPHTAYLHAGLFRNASSPRREIEVVLRRFRDRVEAEYLGEPRPPGLAARILAPRGGNVTHFDCFLLPSIVQVEYALGEGTHFCVTAALTPVSRRHTRIFAEVAYRLPFPGWLVAPVLGPLALRVFRQDAGILREQTSNVERFGGEAYRSTEVDFLGPQILRLLRHAGEAGDSGSQAPVERRFRMLT